MLYMFLGIFFYKSLKLSACHSTCKTCRNGTPFHCLTCPLGLLLKDGQCVSSCDLGFYKEGNRCLRKWTMNDLFPYLSSYPTTLPWCMCLLNKKVYRQMQCQNIQTLLSGCWERLKLIPTRLLSGFLQHYNLCSLIKFNWGRKLFFF